VLRLCFVPGPAMRVLPRSASDAAPDSSGSARSGEGWVALGVIASFAKMKAMSTHLPTVQLALRTKTPLLQLDEAGERCSRPFLFVCFYMMKPLTRAP
jgi:hypothetical protein